MVEYDEFLNKYTGGKALQMRVLYRLRVKKGEIPYFDGGIDMQIYTYSKYGMELEIKSLLKDIGHSVRIEGDRVIVGTVNVALPVGDM